MFVASRTLNISYGIHRISTRIELILFPASQEIYSKSRLTSTQDFYIIIISIISIRDWILEESHVVRRDMDPYGLVARLDTVCCTGVI